MTNEEKTFVRGLEGVVAAETNISWVDGIHGKLYYWGYDIHDFAEQVCFEEVIFLLWNGRFPNRKNVSNFELNWLRKCVFPVKW